MRGKGEFIWHNNRKREWRGKELIIAERGFGVQRGGSCRHNSQNKPNKEKGKRSPEPDNSRRRKWRIHIVWRLSRYDFLLNRLNMRKPNSVTEFLFDALILGHA